MSFNFNTPPWQATEYYFWCTVTSIYIARGSGYNICNELVHYVRVKISNTSCFHILSIQMPNWWRKSTYIRYMYSFSSTAMMQEGKDAIHYNQSSEDCCLYVEAILVTGRSRLLKRGRWTNAGFDRKWQLIDRLGVLVIAVRVPRPVPVGLKVIRRHSYCWYEAYDKYVH